MLLRDSADRAVSHYYMERSKGNESAPLWLALLAEPWRLRRCAKTRDWGSAARVHSYRIRGLYSFQLRNLHRYFPRQQMLVVSNRLLLRDHQAALRRIFSFLGVSENVSTCLSFLTMAKRPASAGDLLGKRRHPILSWLLGLSYLAERRRARGLYQL